MSQPNPRFETPNDDPQLKPLDEPSRSLVEEMAPVVDEMRQMVVDFGFRPYRVWLVRVQWSEGEIGRGEAIIVQEREFLPTPFFDSSPVYSRFTSGGKVDQGNVTLREVSPRYTEDEIWGWFAPERGQQVFIEVRHDKRDGETERRRFAVVGQPWRNAKDWSWVVRMTTEQQARERNGALDVVETYPERGTPV